MLAEVGHRIHETQRGRAIHRVQAAGHDRAAPATHARKHRHILFPVGTLVGHRLADNPGAGFELPQRLPAARVESLEPAVHRSVEDHIARGHHGAAPRGKFLGHLPYCLRVDGVPRGELAPMAAGAGVHLDVRADIRRARDIVGLHALHLGAQVVVRDVLETGFR